MCSTSKPPTKNVWFSTVNDEGVLVRVEDGVTVGKTRKKNWGMDGGVRRCRTLWGLETGVGQGEEIGVRGGFTRVRPSTEI